MKKGIIAMMMIVMVALAFTTGEASAKAKDTSLAKAKAYAEKHYPKHKVKVVNEGKVPAKRKSAKVIYIEKIKVKATGGRNAKARSGHIRLLKPAKRGRRLTIYLVWSPRNNAIDDVVAKATQGKIIGDR